MMLHSLSNLVNSVMSSDLLHSVFNYLLQVQDERNRTLWGMDLSIESLRSQGTSNFIFGFLIVSLIIYAMIIFVYWPKTKKEGKLKTGEKYMLGAIILSIFIAIFFGYLQLIDGYLV